MSDYVSVEVNVSQIAAAVVAEMPQNMVRSIKDKRRGLLCQLRTRVCDEDLGVNRYVLKTILRYFPDHVPGKYVLMDIILVINDLLENTLLHAYSEEERDAGALKIAETLKQMIQAVRGKARKWRFLDKVSPGRTVKRDPNIAALIRQLQFPEESKEAWHEEEEPAEETEEWDKDDAVIEFDTEKMKLSELDALEDELEDIGLEGWPAVQEEWGDAEEQWDGAEEQWDGEEEQDTVEVEVEEEELDDEKIKNNKKAVINRKEKHKRNGLLQSLKSNGKKLGKGC